MKDNPESAKGDTTGNTPMSAKPASERGDNDKGEILNVELTSDNVDDRRLLRNFAEDLHG